MSKGNNVNAKAAALAVQFLKQGVDLAFGMPGSGPTLNFISTFVRHGGRFVICKHEGSAPIMAGTIGKRENNPMLAICANGTARTNLLSGILHCWFEKLPVIGMWDCYSHDVSDIQRLQRLPKHDFSPFFRELLDGIGKNAEGTAEFLIRASLEPEHGPVGIHLRSSEHDLPTLKAPNASPANSCGKSYFEGRKKAERPVFIFGSAACYDKNIESIRKEFSKFPVPKLTTIGAKGMFSEDDPFCLRVFTGVGGVNTPERMVINKADLIIGINLRHSDVIRVKPFEKHVILFDTMRLDESYGYGGESCLIRSGEELIQWVSQLINPTWTEDECQSIMEKAKEHILIESNESARLINAISELLYGKVTVVVDDGIYQKQSEYFWLTDHHTRYVGTGVGRNMGSALPASIALTLRYPEEPVVCLTGDGGLPMYLGELGLLPHLHCGKLLIIHFADFEMGSIKISMHLKQIKNTQGVVEVPTSYCNTLRGFGFKAISQENIDDVYRSIKHWINHPENMLIEFRLRKDDYAKTFLLIR